MAGGYDRIADTLVAYVAEHGWRINLATAAGRVVAEHVRARGITLPDGRAVEGSGVVVSCPVYDAMVHLFEPSVFSGGVLDSVGRLNRTASVVKSHYCLSRRIDTRQIVFPVGNGYTAKEILFVSNITPSVSANGEHLMVAGTSVRPEDASDASMVRKVVDAMKSNIASMYPDFEDALLWKCPMTWKLVESVAEELGIVWKGKMPHQIRQIGGLYFVRDYHKLWDRHGFGRAQLHVVPPQDNEASAAVTAAAITASARMNLFTPESFLGIRM